MSRALRICMVAACPVPAPRGTPVRVTRFSEALARQGHEVHLVTYGEGSGEEVAGVRLHRIPHVPGIRVDRPGPTLGKLLLLDPLLTLRLRRVLRAHAFDVIHAHHYEGLLMAAAVAPAATPVIYDAHTVLETELPSYGRWIPSGPVRVLGRSVDRWLPGRARLVVAASEALHAHLVAIGAVAEERIEVVGNGVDLGLFPPAAPPSPPPPDGGTLVYAGNLAPYQGIDLLLEAFRTVLDHRPAARLRILTHDHFGPFESRARRLDLRSRIDVRPAPLSRLPGELAEAHVAVNPRPRCDGVPQKNLNYMAAGAALVAFEGSVQPCTPGGTAVAVAPATGEALGRAVLRLLEDDAARERLGAAARELLERDYTWDRQGARLVELYRRVTDGDAGRAVAAGGAAGAAGDDGS